MSEKVDTPNKIVEKLLALTQENLLPWQCPWIVRQPRNPISGSRYSGMNWLLLSWKMGECDGENRFVTYKQVQKYAKDNKKSMFVRGGEKGTMGVRYGIFQKVEVDANGKSKISDIPYLTTFTVFNVTQVEGWDIPNTDSYGTVALPNAEELINRMGIAVKVSNQAAYSPTGDYLLMPPADTFKTPQDHLHAVIHELIHATGHKSRLDRKGMEEGYKQKYAVEELVAEIGTAMAMAQLGIANDTEQSAEYIKGWWSVIKNNPKSFVWAVGKAQKAVEYLLGTPIENVEVDEEAVANNQAYVG